MRAPVWGSNSRASPADSCGAGRYRSRLATAPNTARRGQSGTEALNSRSSESCQLARRCVSVGNYAMLSRGSKCVSKARPVGKMEPSSLTVHFMPNPYYSNRGTVNAPVEGSTRATVCIVRCGIAMTRVRRRALREPHRRTAWRVGPLIGRRPGVPWAWHPDQQILVLVGRSRRGRPRLHGKSQAPSIIRRRPRGASGGSGLSAPPRCGAPCRVRWGSGAVGDLRKGAPAGGRGRIAKSDHTRAIAVGDCAGVALAAW